MVGVRVTVLVGVGVNVLVGVGVKVLVGVGVKVSVGVGVKVLVGVGVLVDVLVTVGVGVLVGVLVTVGVKVLVGVAVGVGVLVGVLVTVGVGVLVGVLVTVGVSVSVGVGVKVLVGVGVLVGCGAALAPRWPLSVKKTAGMTNIPAISIASAAACALAGRLGRPQVDTFVYPPVSRPSGVITNKARTKIFLNVAPTSSSQGLGCDLPGTTRTGRPRALIRSGSSAARRSYPPQADVDPELCAPAFRQVCPCRNRGRPSPVCINIRVYPLAVSARARAHLGDFPRRASQPSTTLGRPEGGW